MEVPEESFHWSSWDSRTCYPRRAFIQGLTDDQENVVWERDETEDATVGEQERYQHFSFLSLEVY